MYFNTAEKTTKIYSDGAWGDLGGGAEPGQLPTYTTAQRDALSPAAGLQIYNTTENTVQLYSQTAWKTVGAKLALAATCSLDGDCDSTHCVDGLCCETACSGTVCQTCGALSSAGSGHCGYVNSSSDDPRNTCTTASVPNADSCKSPNCNGTGYACGYLSEEASQPTCKRCTGSSYDPANIANAAQDTEGSNLCTATHYRCDGAGTCTAPYTTLCIAGAAPNCETSCINAGYGGCKHAHYSTCAAQCVVYTSCYLPYDCAGPYYGACICKIYIY